MSAERWERVQSLFHTALERAPAERADFLARECAGDGELLRDVLELLDAAMDSASGEFIGEAVRSASREVTAPELRAGLRLDEYRLIRELGQGGMGAVWLAERADGEYRAQVAIKIVQGGPPGSTFERRFRIERQVLADLEHPNIARLIDAGATPAGTPYLVMEYVEGQPLLRWAEERRLDLHQRLRLFLEVCAAVRHAHGSLVVHRDLKPSNILVRADGTPKLVDFGIAKLLGQDGQSVVETFSLVRVLTPVYASPEQLRGERITVATDVYSLGVLLYELLAGRHPFASDRTPPLELRRRILEDTPEPPSRARAAQPDAAHPVQARELRGDLDAVALRAIEKNPARRYGTVAELMEELRRVLADEPVGARRAGAMERSARFVRRHAAAFGALAAGVVALATLLTFETVRLVRERDAALDARSQTGLVLVVVTSLLATDVDARPAAMLSGLSAEDFAFVLAGVRESLDVGLPAGDVRRAVAISRLGGLLVDTGRPAEAEPLLLEGFAALEGRPDAEAERAAAAERLVRLYETTGRPEQAAPYRAAARARPPGSPDGP